jgi:hypothetical protein
MFKFTQIEKLIFKYTKKGWQIGELFVDYRVQLYFNENLIDNNVRNIAGCVHMGINYKILGTK